MTATSSVVTDALHDLHWSVTDLWVAATGIGGSLTHPQVAAIAAGTLAPTPIDHDILVAALNDGFLAVGLDHPLAYWADTDHPRA